MKNFFGKIGGVFSKLFGKAPSALQVASTTLTLTAPIIEEVYAKVSKDPGDAAEAANVIAEVQADMAAAGALIAGSHNSADATTYQKLSTIVTSINNNLDALLAAGHIKDAGTIELVKTAVAELQAILTVLPQAQAAAA